MRGGDGIMLYGEWGGKGNGLGTDEILGVG